MNEISDVAQKLINLTIAQIRIFNERAVGQATSIADIVKECGFRSESEFWDMEMSEPMKHSSFVHLLRDCLSPPAYEMAPTHSRTWLEEIERIEAFLHQSLAVAFDTEKQPWFIETPDKQLLVRPREAAEWLLSKPKRRDLVPAGLKVFLENGQGSVTAPAPAVASVPRIPGKSGRPRGTGFQKKDEVLHKEMKELIDSGTAKSVTEAARMMASRAEGASEPAKIDRLVGGYKQTEFNRR